MDDWLQWIDLRQDVTNASSAHISAVGERALTQGVEPTRPQSFDTIRSLIPYSLPKFLSLFQEPHIQPQIMLSFSFLNIADYISATKTCRAWCVTARKPMSREGSLFNFLLIRPGRLRDVANRPFLWSRAATLQMCRDLNLSTDNQSVVRDMLANTRTSLTKFSGDTLATTQIDALEVLLPQLKIIEVYGLEDRELEPLLSQAFTQSSRLEVLRAGFWCPAMLDHGVKEVSASMACRIPSNFETILQLQKFPETQLAQSVEWLYANVDRTPNERSIFNLLLGCPSVKSIIVEVDGMEMQHALLPDQRVWRSNDDRDHDLRRYGERPLEHLDLYELLMQEVGSLIFFSDVGQASDVWAIAAMCFPHLKTFVCGLPLGLRDIVELKPLICTRLETLKFNLNLNQFDSNWDNVLISTEQALMHLDPIFKSIPNLQELDLTLQVSSVSVEDSTVWQLPRQVFKALPALRTLRISMVATVDISLAVVVVDFEDIVGWFDGIGELCPDLQTVSIYYHVGVNDPVYTNFTRDAARKMKTFLAESSIERCNMELLPSDKAPFGADEGEPYDDMWYWAPGDVLDVSYKK